ncbi:MAG: primosomal protein N' [Gammaproteobacteria bacterium]
MDPVTPPTILKVAIDTPLRQAFDYLPPREGPVPAPGTRVLAPFGRRQLVGVIVSHEQQSDLDSTKLKPISRAIDPVPTFDPELLKLLRWAADYYHHPIGEAVATALPRLAREGAPLRETVEWWSLTPEGATAWAAGEPRRAPRQRGLLQALAPADVGPTTAVPTTAVPTTAVDEATLNARLPGWRDAAKPLLARGWIARHEDLAPAGDAPAMAEADAAAPSPTAGSPARAAPPAPNAAQQAALDALAAADDDRYHGWLLHGVTGSGKTEVYLRLAERHLARGRSVLVLVPEIGLTPQLVGRFAARFPQTPLAVLHSGLTDTARLEAWRRAHAGAARLVLGTRSAVFAPLPGLGLIIVDEEHDASFKQQEGGFRYSARDLALVRAQGLGIPVVLGSATPSLETLHNAATGRLTRIVLPERAAAAQPPLLRLVDLRAERVHAGLSTTAVTAIERHLAAAGQVLVYINRRGYAPTLACTACGWVAPCTSCDARMTVYRNAERLRCHHCGADRDLPRQCPQCGYAVKTVGQGTELIEETLAETFPGVGIARLDRDVVRRADELEAVLGRVASGEARILVGTQMVAKGHDFPAVTLAVVLNADQGLFSTDFRAAERLAQTLVQVAGRAGRGAQPGEVLIQTEHPDHPLLRGLVTGGYESFAAAALAERRDAAWPPFARLAALRASGLTAEDAIAFLEAARRIADHPPEGLRLLGPAPAAMARRADRHHAQLLIDAGGRSVLHRFLDAWLPQVEALPEARRVRWALDVDPLELF